MSLKNILRLSHRITVNWHLEKDCNYKCKFCYAHFQDVTTRVGFNESLKLLDTIRENGIYKINFAGGEPFLNKNLGDYIKYSKGIGMKTSVITNASKMTNSWLDEYSEYIDQIGISCDSLSNEVNTELGRGFGNHINLIKRALQRIRQIKINKNLPIQIKLNSVILRNNHMEDWNEFILNNDIDRWKVLKILKIIGENEHVYDELSITDDEFNAFIDRHPILEDQGILVKESNDDMEMSYLMITPDGRFYQNKNNEYIYSDPILTVGFQNAMEQCGFDYEKYIRRGGSYSL